MQEDKDFFDKIMDYRIFSPFRKLYYNNKEIILYLFFGGLTFFIAIGVFSVLTYYDLFDVLLINLISWFCGVTFSYFTTKQFVFNNKTNNKKQLFAQVISFYMARVATLLLQEGLLYVFVKKLHCNSIIIKIITEFINIVLNYLVSKYIIFRKQR